MSLAGKWISVIGSGGDIGQAIVSKLGELGAHNSIPKRECPIDPCDTASQASVDEHFQRLEKNVLSHGKALDGMVVCHGAPGCIKPSLELTDAEFEAIIQADLIGTFRVCRAAARYMIPQGFGRIVTFSSIHAIAPYPQRAAYAAAKAGVVGLTKALAIEWAKYGLQVNCVLPGQVADTRRSAAVVSRRLIERSPAVRLVPMEAVTAAVEFLLGTTGINGHALVVDDGWTSSSWFDTHA